MKTIYAFALSLMLLSACSSYKEYVSIVPAKQSSYSLPEHFLDIPLPPHNRKIDILVPGEVIPDSMILPVRLVEVRSKGGTLQGSLGKIGEIAKKQGLDGVILTDRYLTFGSDSVGEVYVASGIGFIYEHHLPLINLRIKSRKIAAWTGDYWKEVGEVKYSMQGEIDTVMVRRSYRKKFAELVVPYDLELLQNSFSKGGWREKWDEIPGGNRHSLIHTVLFREGGNLSTEITQALQLNYRNKRLFSFNRSYTPAYKKAYGVKKKKKESAQITYKDGLVYIVNFERDGRKHHYQKYTYDKYGRPEQGMWYSWLSNDMEFPITKITYRYYKESDYRPALRFAPDIPMRASREKF